MLPGESLQIKTPLFPEATRKAVQAILERHGARLEVCCLIYLPEGTRKERAGLMGAYHEQNKYTLPDGFEIFQVVDTEGWSTIRFAREEEKS